MSITINFPEGVAAKVRVQTKTAVLPDGAQFDANGNAPTPQVHWQDVRNDAIAPGNETRTYDISANQRLIIEG